jgi:hypothetical protein
MAADVFRDSFHEKRRDTVPDPAAARLTPLPAARELNQNTVDARDDQTVRTASLILLLVGDADLDFR